MNYDSQKEIINVLTERGLRPTKKFGQNFMISRAAREKVLSYVGIKEGDSVWEIGGGLGSMTSMALDRAGLAGHLTVFEIDRGYIDFLSEQFGSHPGFRIVAGDMVKTWRTVAEETGKPDVIFGNLPYNSASAMITQLIEGDCLASRMVFTVQKEMGLRITAKPGSADYSSFSVFCQLACDTVRPAGADMISSPLSLSVSLTSLPFCALNSACRYSFSSTIFSYGLSIRSDCR